MSMLRQTYKDTKWRILLCMRKKSRKKHALSTVLKLLKPLIIFKKIKDVKGDKGLAYHFSKQLWDKLFSQSSNAHYFFFCLVTQAQNPQHFSYERLQQASASTICKSPVYFQQAACLKHWNMILQLTATHNRVQMETKRQWEDKSEFFSFLSNDLFFFHYRNFSTLWNKTYVAVALQWPDFCINPPTGSFHLIQ